MFLTTSLQRRYFILRHEFQKSNDLNDRAIYIIFHQSTLDDQVNTFMHRKIMREKKVTRKTNIRFRGYNTVSLERLMTKEKHRLVRIGLWSMKWSKHLQFKFFSINFQVNENALLHRATKFRDKLWGLFFLFTFRTFVVMCRCVYINEVMEFIFFISSVRAKDNRKKRRSFQTWLHCSKKQGKLGICRIENRAIYNHSRLILVC